MVGCNGATAWRAFLAGPVGHNAMSYHGLVILLALWVTPAAAGGQLDVSTYEGRNLHDQWRNTAQGRIEKFRKSKLIVEVRQLDGKPAKGIEVRVEMRRHAFGFGSAITAFDLTSETPDGQRYRDMVERSFNKVVLENDLKWANWELSAKRRKDTIYDRDRLDSALRWLAQKRIAVRGHYAVWGGIKGERATEARISLGEQRFRDELMAHAEDVVRTIGSRVSEWDVVNHPIGYGADSLIQRLGFSVYKDAFIAVREWNPAAVRYLNEDGILTRTGYNRKRYFDLVKEMIAHGVPLDAIGFMGHFRVWKGDLMSPEAIYRVLDEFAAFGLPLQVTEFDVLFGKTMGDRVVLTDREEQLQADFTRDFMTVVFSHPAVVAIVMWGLWEGRHWYPEAALYRQDWTQKPNARVWEDLVRRQWRTSKMGSTGDGGTFEIDGFHGEYEITVRYKGRTYQDRVALGPGGISHGVVLSDPSYRRPGKSVE